MMIPKIALIGRLNVGKSTLFNLLTSTRSALIADLPGMTRDRKYGYAEVKGRKFICIDTGGFNENKKELEVYIVKQSLLAINEADLIFFLVDAHTGLMPLDSEIAKYLHFSKKLTYLIVNKTDGINSNQAISDFWLLGFNQIYPISAFHHHGVTNLLKSTVFPFIDKINSSKRINIDTDYWMCSENKKKDKKKLKNHLYVQSLPIKVAVVGCPNVGKSMLINCILGEERVIVCNMPGTTRDSIYIPMQRDYYQYTLIDTAGIRKRRKISEIVEKFCVIQSLEAIKDANVVLLVIDAQKNISNQDLSLIGLIINIGRPLVIVVNKSDSINSQKKKQIKKTLDYRLNFINFVRVHFVSALRKSGIDDLFRSILEAYENSIHYRSSSILTRIMNISVKNHQPPLLYRGRRAKFTYAHIDGYNPPIIVIYGNQVKDLPNSYKRYLINCFRQSLGMIGTPIHLYFRENVKFAKH